MILKFIKISFKVVYAIFKYLKTFIRNFPFNFKNLCSSFIENNQSHFVSCNNLFLDHYHVNFYRANLYHRDNSPQNVHILYN